MEIADKINNLKKYVSKYDTESFAGFFAYLLRQRSDRTADIDLNKFESKLKDFFYLIALNLFSEEKGTQDFDFSPEAIGFLADRVNDIKSHYLIKKFSDYTSESVIHEMAFRNHFDNGVLSYVEQDLEKIRTTFLPFEDKIMRDFGLDIDFLIEAYKATELISKIRFDQIMEYAHTKEFKEFREKFNSKEVNLSEAFDMLPEKVQNGFLSFQAKTHRYLLFSKDDLYLTLPKEKVDIFLQLFSCSPSTVSDFQYYTDYNPIELAPIIRLSENKYLHVCQKQIPIAIYRRIYNHLISDNQYNKKVRRHREKSLERKVAEIFKSFFPSRDAFFYENYFVDKNREQDLLILHKGTALVVETKASKLREPFRDIQKATVRLKCDFKDAIQYGYDQCRRVENFFTGTDKFTIMDERSNVLHEVNANRIHSVYSIIVTLERFGSLQTDLGLLMQKEENAQYPWSVYIDDLETFLLTLKHHVRNPQRKLFDFLKSRAKLHKHLYSIDELDICASFLNEPKKFAANAKRKDTLVTFSPLEQNLFDSIYYVGGLKFKEKPMPDFYYITKK